MLKTKVALCFVSPRSCLELTAASNTESWAWAPNGLSPRHVTVLATGNGEREGFAFKIVLGIGPLPPPPPRPPPTHPPTTGPQTKIVGDSLQKSEDFKAESPPQISNILYSRRT